MHCCYLCTHGWPDRPRAKGTRPQLKLRGMQSPFRFIAESVYVEASWKVEIHHPIYTHNHTLSRDVFDNYPHNHQVPIGELIVKDLRSGGKGLRIYEYIRDHSAYKVTRKNVANLMDKIRTELFSHQIRDLANDLVNNPAHNLNNNSNNSLNNSLSIATHHTIENEEDDSLSRSLSATPLHTKTIWH
ncbi:hypothetical protein PHMEG_00020150 [Phytophthora megakarya]|uniref:Uncharacterized protein n=1 Tax=Phytophthora megakarya TaxID=4795 RepID=A0A225VPV0_9STRA|nr:hypothetical protein PHMEG_00020150 [Phytophthora megakarya]